MSLPDSLNHKIELFRQVGRAFRYEEELFSKTSWIAIFLGQGIMPQTYDPIVAGLPYDIVDDSLASMRAAMETTAAAMLPHQDFIQRYCPAPTLEPLTP
jgi:tryptophan halogenase